MPDFFESLITNIVAVIAELLLSADPKATSTLIHGTAFTSGY